jgi:uncharacterized protein
MHVANLVGSILLSVLPLQDATRRVHDFANLLSAEQSQAIDAICRDVERQTTAQIAVVTVPSLDGKTVDDYAHELFNAWGIGLKEVNNGALLLVAPNERRARIEVGYGLEPLLTDALCGEILDVHAVPRFRASDYPGGIEAATRAIADILLADPATARGDPNSGPLLARRSRQQALYATAGVAALAVGLLIASSFIASRRNYSSIAFLVITGLGLIAIAAAAFLTFRAPEAQQPWGWLGGASAASLGAWFSNLKRYRRFGPHNCSKCGAQLQLLGNQEEHAKLTEVQNLEEKIGSVDYDVWYCPACLNADTERYLRPFSGFSECPKCGARAYKEDPQKTVRAATRTNSGLARIDGRCVSCNHKTSRTVMLPVLPAPRSSGSGGSFGGGGFGGGGGGGGGFGGGSSGGGGASRGW